MEIRINKYIASCGICSRRKADGLIEAGKVLLNGKKANFGSKLNPELDKVIVNGQVIKPQGTLEYVMLNKPKAVVTTMRDPEGRTTIKDFIKSKKRLYPVGRLDYNSRGLLLLTNDGELATKLMHPRYEHPKTYIVKTKQDINSKQIKLLRMGIQLEEGKTLPAKVIRKSSKVIEITLFQGLNRQIRRMCEAVGLKVLDIDRISIGSLHIGNLKPGQSRNLSEEEVVDLKKLLSKK